ncbi:UPF0182 family protein [Lusitaniella coriacea LEGE 07157]|uniref:UPF0182 protein IQ249_23920 n=1 Tax=Lusitaniella coriacea LEGE 07157 TaxID=945747 RepID=A0A8J7E032_9CYAN|nr:UPF0182 family protein [Lusitaniella coriacea]MBE9118941.1 UPF0182 family protein [Lusitaniella coriacea LEGE 07157]
MFLKNRGFRVVVVVLGILLAFDLVATLSVEVLWFEKLGYLSTLLVRLRTQLGLWAIATVGSAVFLASNLVLANRFKWEYPIQWNEADLKALHPGTSRSLIQFPMQLRVLLPLVFALCLLVGFILINCGTLALDIWHPDYNLPNATPNVPPPLSFKAFLETLPAVINQQQTALIGTLSIVAGIIVFLLINPQFCLWAIALGMSLLFGFVVSGNWAQILQSFNAIPFKKTDPIFTQDISFYIYKLPLWQILYFWLGGLFLYGFVACLLIYLLSGHSLSKGKFPGFSPVQLRHLSGLGSLGMVVQALHHWFARYELLYSNRGVVYGIGYTEFYVQRPVELVLFFLANAIAIWLFLRTLGTQPEKIFPKPQLRGVVGFYIGVLILAGLIFPSLVQRLGVQPNELARETPYIKNNIVATRAAFALDGGHIEVQTFNPQAQLTLAKLEEHEQTIDNIRLWDTRPILTTLRQLQQIRLYYSFPSADVDRYTLQLDPQPQPMKQQVIIAARELDYNLVPDEAKTWVNKHLAYTHGYGFTVSPVNRVGEGGLPDYLVQDIGTAEKEGQLLVADDRVAQSIPIANPRIYYGELTANYIMTPTRASELDFPSGNENVYTTYQGTGGILLGSGVRRLLFAEFLKDWQMLFTENFQPDTRILLRRDLKRRLRAIAPFLRYDLDPYLVSVDAGNPPEGSPPNYLYWIIDAYTTSARYPYSNPGDYSFNYIRNSVKVIIDAYNGDVSFYVADSEDPIVQSWQQIFPQMFKPLQEMPANLRAHLRYPADLLNVQSERLLTYHMIDPTVFYNREDQWQIPQEIYGTERQPVKPYHLIMKLPSENNEEFVLLQPFTPTARPNLIAWLAARSDGDSYGKLLLYQFPKQKLVYGIGQIEALINQDPVISQLISLWNTQGSKAIQGNLLVIPIEQSLLYVEPLYLEAEQNGLPTLVRVIVAYDNRIVIANTLEQAFEQLFPEKAGKPAPKPEDAATPAIIRTLEELTP